MELDVDARGYRRYWDEERETMDPRARERLILERIQHQLRYVYERLPFYRRLYDERGFHPDQVASLEDFTTRVPVVTKRMLVEDQRAHPPFGSYTGDVGPDDVARIQGSSGTSGHPTFYRVSRCDWDRAADAGAMALWTAGVRPCDVAQIGFPFSLFFGGWGVIQGLERLGATCFPLGAIESERQVELMHKVGSTFFSATPSYCQHLITVAERMGLNLADGPVGRLVVGAEPGGSLPGTKQALTDGWGASVHDCASTSEMYPFMTNVESEAHEGMLVYTDEVFTEVVDRDDPNVPVPYGTEGAVVYTHLWRESQPMIRFWPGDATVMIDDPPSCGRTYPRLPRGIIGRLDDMLIVRGVNVYPSTVETALRRTPGLGPEFQIVVQRRQALDEMTVRAELADGLVRELAAASPRDGEERRAAVAREAEHHLRALTGLRVPVELLEPRTLPETVFKARRVVDLREQAQQAAPAAPAVTG
jgi:phenylacetate-CoA ligase